MPVEIEIMNTQQAAKLLNVHEVTLRKLAREKKIPAFRIGESWRYKTSELNDWIKAQGVIGKIKTVLIVDDEEDVRQTMKRSLDVENYNVITARNGEEALALYHENDVDLIFLDLKMDGMNGAAVLQAIRQGGGTTPVVILTAYPDSDLMAQAMKYSPFTLLAKPTSLQQISCTAREVLAGVK